MKLTGEQVLARIWQKAAKIERDVAELKDRVNFAGHPDDKADIAARSAKMYCAFQALESLAYDIEQDSRE